MEEWMDKQQANRWTDGLMFGWINGWVVGRMDRQMDKWMDGWIGGQVATEWIAITQCSGRRETLALRLRVSPMEPRCLGLIPSDRYTDHGLVGLKGLVFSTSDVNKSRAVVRIM